MLVLKPGTIVVRKYSRATQMKRMVFRVLSQEPHTYKVTLLNAYGKKSTEDRWRVEPLEWAEDRLKADVRFHEEVLGKRKKRLEDFRKEVRLIPQYFPDL